MDSSAPEDILASVERRIANGNHESEPSLKRTHSQAFDVEKQFAETNSRLDLLIKDNEALKTKVTELEKKYDASIEQCKKLQRKVEYDETDDSNDSCFVASEGSEEDEYSSDYSSSGSGSGSESEKSDSEEKLILKAVENEKKKRGGRPPGSKNRAKPDKEKKERKKKEVKKKEEEKKNDVIVLSQSSLSSSSSTTTKKEEGGEDNPLCPL